MGTNGHRRQAWGLCLPRARPLQVGGCPRNQNKRRGSGRVPEVWHPTLPWSPLERSQGPPTPTPSQGLKGAPKPWQS